jgi:phosphoadenosine phosphosulfate reductase
MNIETALSVIETEIERAAAPCVTASFQADCVVLVHLLRAARPRIPVLFLDTVHHFPETYEYRDRLTRDWGLDLVNLRAQAPAPGLWRSSTHDCCARHKVAPLFAALEAYDVWFAALRREQSPSRAALPHSAPFTLPSGRNIRKVCPLVEWTTADVWRYARAHEIPLLSLYDVGYTSIGCEPCTIRPPDPSNPRSGRWLGQKLECGIHLDARHRDAGSAGDVDDAPGPPR